MELQLLLSQGPDRGYFRKLFTDKVKVWLQRKGATSDRCKCVCLFKKRMQPSLQPRQVHNQEMVQVVFLENTIYSLTTVCMN